MNEALTPKAIVAALDTHIIGFQKLGADFSYNTEDGFFHLTCKGLKGADLLLDEPSGFGLERVDQGHTVQSWPDVH